MQRSCNSNFLCLLGLGESELLSEDFASVAEDNPGQNPPPSATLSSDAVATGDTSHVSSVATPATSIPFPLSSVPTSIQAAYAARSPSSAYPKCLPSTLTTLRPSLPIKISEGGSIYTYTIESISQLSQPSQPLMPLSHLLQPVMQVSLPLQSLLPLSQPSQSTASTSLHVAASSVGILQSSAGGGCSTIISWCTDNSYIPPSLRADTSRKKVAEAQSRVVPVKLLKIGGRSVFVLKQIDKNASLHD